MKEVVLFPANVMQNDKDAHKLPIPANVTDSYEVIPGIGSTELKMIGTAVAFGVAAGIISYVIWHVLVLSIIIVLIFPYVGYLFSVRNANNESLLDRLRYIRNYRKSQKLYLYEYKDEYYIENERTKGYESTEDD